MNKIITSLLILLANVLCYGQDLVITEITGPKIFAQYEELSSTVVTIKNTGIVATADTYITINLSTNNIPDADDKYIGALNTGVLAAGESKSLSLAGNSNFYIKAPAGDYHLIAFVDSNSSVPETDETNNKLITAGYVVNPSNADFQFTALSSDKDSYYVNDVIKLAYEIRNNGPANIGGYLYTAFYLSTDQMLDSNDPLLQRFGHFLKGPDIIVNGSLDELNIPNVTPGQYYIIAKTDDHASAYVYTETDETNNTSAKAITILNSDADLEISAINYAFNDGGNINNQIAVSFETRNNGTTGVSGYTITGYLTLEPGINYPRYEAAPYYFSGSVSYIGGGKTAPQNILLSNFDPMPEPGPYYLTMEINPNGDIRETNTGNNTITWTERVYINPPAFPSVMLTNAQFNGTYDNTDQELNLDLNFYNSGTTYMVLQQYQILIRDALNNIQYSGSQYENFYFYPGESVARNWVINLQHPLSNGEYTVEIICTDPQSCTSPYYSLALKVDQAVYTLSGTIQGEDGTPITKGKLFLYQKDDNGVVKFINKVVPTTGSLFSFEVDNHEHTLYFIPDPTDFPDYIPTILGKSVILNDNSFISITENTELTYEILKLKPLATGTKSISGTITPGSTSGRAMRTMSVESIPVILLSETGEPVAITYTDGSGYFEFNNLPAGNYQIVAAFELDQVVMNEPLAVDVTKNSATIDLQITPGGINTNTEIFFKEQTISFNDLPIKKYGDTPFSLSAATNSGLTVSYTSTDPSVAYIENGKVVIKSAGTTTITALQHGDDDYKPATPVEHILTIEKGDQAIIDFGDLAEKQYGDENFILSANTTSGLAVSFTSDNEEVAKIEGNVVSIHGPGVAQITALQKGNGNYAAAEPVTRTLVVNQVTAIEPALESLQIYPNPTSGILFLHAAAPVTQASLSDALGKQQTSIFWVDNKMDISQLNPGIYLLKIESSSSTKIFRIVKE